MYTIYKSTTLSKVTVLQVFDHRNLISEQDVLVQLEKQAARPYHMN